jgi:hypothetical protein
MLTAADIPWTSKSTPIIDRVISLLVEADAQAQPPTGDLATLLAWHVVELHKARRTLKGVARVAAEWHFHLRGSLDMLHQQGHLFFVRLFDRALSVSGHGLNSVERQDQGSMIR